jgi:hypothetical protein
MEKVVRVARSFEEADRADREYYQSLIPLYFPRLYAVVARKLERGFGGPATMAG